MNTLFIEIDGKAEGSKETHIVNSFKTATRNAATIFSLWEKIIAMQDVTEVTTATGQHLRFRVGHDEFKALIFAAAAQGRPLDMTYEARNHRRESQYSGPNMQPE